TTPNGLRVRDRGRSVRRGGWGIQPNRNRFPKTKKKSAYVQDNSTSPSPSLTVTKGNLIVVMVLDIENSRGQTVSLSDGLGNTYRQAGPYVRLNSDTDGGLSGEITVSIWYTITVASGTCTPSAVSSGTTTVYNLAEFTNADPVSPFGNASTGLVSPEIDS